MAIMFSKYRKKIKTVFFFASYIFFLNFFYYICFTIFSIILYFMLENITKFVNSSTRSFYYFDNRKHFIKL